MRHLLHDLFFTFIATLLVAGDAACGNEGKSFDRLVTKDGREFLNAEVKRADEEGLVIQHSGGMARVSFFDLSREIQEKYDFDPVAAMQAYRQNQEKEREFRQQRTLEAAKLKAEAERKLAAAELQKRAEKEWLPNEAHIVSVQENGAYAIVEKIRFEPTTITSKLGFENPGPPKRITEPLGGGLLFLRSIAHEFTPSARWKGYMEPFPTAMKPHPDTGEKSVPVHLAVPPP